MQTVETTKAGTVELIKKGSIELTRVQYGEHRSEEGELLVADTVERGRVFRLPEGIEYTDLERFFKSPEEIEYVDLGPVVTVGIWRYEGGEFPFEFPYSEAKMVIEGKLVVKDGQGAILTAEAGDIFLFRAPVKVTFMGESKGLIFYATHRTPDTI